MVIISFTINDMDGFISYYLMVIIVFTMNDKNGFYTYVNCCEYYCEYWSNIANKMYIN
jgi:hypothetical protein